MLYVFHVDMGRMMTFDMTVALSSVENLKETIERLHGIPAANIVLLVSGGEMLTKSTQVSYYSAGTDTNPIYMFLTGDVKYPAASLPSGSDADMDLREQVDRCVELPAVLDTVMKRAQLAQKMHDLARDEEKWCERLVHEQHLQQQGWSAVVANMEDLTDEFRQRFKNFCSAFDRHLENRENYLELLKNFASDLTKLSRIPILPALMSLAEEDFHGFDEFLDTDEVFVRSQQPQESVIAAPHDHVSKVMDSEKAAMTTTSPNKKLKMADEGNEEAEEQRTASTGEASTASGGGGGSGGNQRRTFTLLQWISAKENHDTLKLMAEECIQGLGTFNVDVYEKLKAEVQNIIKLADQSDVKDIKGLGERLCKLEEFKYKIKNMVQDQKELSTAFQQNQIRAINLRDASILPDLCASHQSQLLVMLKNHHKIREHKSCITKAKDELGLNLHMRLKRIVLIENAMSEFDNRLLFYHRCLRRAERHLNIIEQIHEAPSIYVAAVTEVVRRKIFSGEFRKWASKLANDFDAIHSEEIQRRQLFNTRFEGHFLNILFPGMNDMPPAFANENPLIFDARLPNITRSDIDMLSSHLPDLSAHVQLPDMAPVINFFVSRSGEHQRERLEELLQQQLMAAQTFHTEKQQYATHARLGDLQKEEAGLICDESETDTEDFENVKQSEVPAAATATEASALAADIGTSTSEFSRDSVAKSTITDHLAMLNVETLTEENESSVRLEMERLRGLLNGMSKLSVECLRVARANVETFRQDIKSYQCDLISELQRLSNNCNLLSVRNVSKEEEEHSELSQLRKELTEKNTALASLKGLREEKEALESRYSLLEAKVAHTLQQLKSAELEKERAVAESREKLIHEHKTEIESLRHRFKLMASPSLKLPQQHSDAQSATEKAAQQNDMIDIACHEMICSQIRADMHATKEREITAALEAERSIWQSKIFPMNSESVMANVNVLKDMLEEKEKQLDMLREQDILLTKENYQLKTRLDALTNEDGNSWLREKIEYLNKDKCRLEDELTMERSRRAEMECSVAELRSSIYEQACVVGSLPRSKSNNCAHKYIVLESCSKGDVVFVVWSIRHGQFMVVQDSQSLYFVHADSLPALNLRFPESSEEGATYNAQSIPMPYYAIGRVVDKEYCQAKKDENRYRVTRGSKFYRIKLAPLSMRQSSRRERSEYFSLSRSVSQFDSPGETTLTSTCGYAPRLSLTMSGANAGAEYESPPVTKKCSKDVIDFGAQLPTTPPPGTPKSATNTQLSLVPYTPLGMQDNMSVPSSLVEPCRFINMSADEEPQIISETAMSLTLQQQQSVITEQPTASSTNLQLDLALASADLPPHLTTNKTTTTATISAICRDPSIVVVTSMSSAVLVETKAATSSNAITIPIASNCGSPSSIPASFGTSEDSDEYRSLDAKDGPSFSISE